MRLRRAASTTLAVACLTVGAFPGSARGADKASTACIQSAEEGETARGAGDLLRARELFTQCAARDCPTVLRRDCATWLDETDRQVPSIVIGARDASGHDVLEAAAVLDGARVQERLTGAPIDLDPGPHVVRVEGAAFSPVEVRVVIRAGEKNRPILASLAPAPPATPPPPTTPPSPPPAPPPPTSTSTHGIPTGAYILGGVGIAALGAFAYFGLRGDHDADVLHSTCAPGCTDAQLEPARHAFLAADVGLGVGAVALVAATWIAVRGVSRPRPAAAWDLTAAPTPGGAQAGATVRF